MAGAVQESRRLVQDAIAAHQAGDFTRALFLYRSVLAQDSGNAHVWQLLGVLQLQSGRLEEAIQHLERAVALDPRHADARNNLGLAYEALGRAADAHTQFMAAVDLNPRHPQALTNLGNLARSRGEIDRAISAYRRALAAIPTLVEARNNLAASLREQGYLSEARNEIDWILARTPKDVAALTNLGTIQLACGDYADALRSLDQALQAAPSSAIARYNRALTLLSQGRLREAWNDYDAGFAVGERFSRDFGARTYRGEPLAGKTLLVYAEQGIGDEIFFAGWLPYFVERAQRVIVDCDPRLAPLLARSYPNILIHGASKHEPTHWIRNMGPVDYQVPIGNLPKFVPDAASPTRAPGSYLRADSAKIRTWTERLSQLGSGLGVGISWRGGATPYARTTRSIPLSQWASILRTTNAHFVCVQYGATSEELAEASALAGKPLHYWPETESLTDLESFSALLCALDIVISVDNSTVHLAGALGVPVFCLISHVPDWRWETPSQGATWYSSVRLFRQERPNEWQSVLEAVRSTLAGLARR